MALATDGLTLERTKLTAPHGLPSPAAAAWVASRLREEDREISGASVRTRTESRAVLPLTFRLIHTNASVLMQLSRIERKIRSVYDVCGVIRKQNDVIFSSAVEVVVVT